ncbi:UvrD-helicase domain-containing protein [Planctomicrobium sp. SH527]|uniref:UvrD-helicase domain-containing protein n=1 Tax=Planctomicrobium sp. SH527 TaxID=3448123 RepID=UPI003F5C5750
MSRSKSTEANSENTPGAVSQRLLIRASAGTGKTFQLSSRYIAILRNSSPEKILASTFTKKAAGEILERILTRLAKAVLDPKELKMLADSVGPPLLTREECLKLLGGLTRNLHRIRISTLDSFFSQLAGSYALELGLPPGWRVLDPLEIDQIRTSAIDEMLSTGTPHDLVQLMHLLDKGKSSRSISRLITETISNLYYVFLAAPEESWERIPDYPFLAPETREMLRVQIEETPLDKVSLTKARAGDVAAIFNEDWESLLKRGLMPKIISGEMKYSRVEIPAGLKQPYEELYRHVLASVAAPWRSQTLAARRLLGDFHTVFERLKHAAGGLEFGDVTRRLAQAQARSRLVDSSFRLDASIDHLLLDEFQDTSPEQWNVIRSFAEEACQAAGSSFFCVGDTKQAIYGWRGGEAALFDLIADELPGGADSQVELNLSYRSSPAIMHAVNVAMQSLAHHDNLEDHAETLHEWGKRFPEHRTARESLSGYVCLRTLSERNADATPADEDAEEPPEFWAEVAAYVRDRRIEAPGASIGILTRRNQSVGRMIFELNQLGIEASEEGGNPLTDSAVVQLLLSLFTLADHPGHTAAAFHVAQSPLGTILKWTNSGDSASRIQFSEALRRRLVDRGYGGLVHELLPLLAPYCNRREYQRLVQLTDLADRYDGLFADLRPSRFVDFVNQQRREEPTSAAVRVMTVHQSKGLEFDIVILPELDVPLYLPPKYVSHRPGPGAPPDLVALYRSQSHFENLGGELEVARRDTQERLFQEALCLLYVALTRPVRSLHILINPKISKKLPKTFAGLVRAAFAPDVPVTPQTILWEHGNPDWYQDLPEPVKSSEPVKTPETEQSRRVIEFAGQSSRRHWKRQSPSGSKTTTQLSLKRVLSSGLSTALTKGTLFHRWIQEIQWIDDGGPSVSLLRRLGHQSGVSDDTVEQWLQSFSRMLQSEWCQNLLGRQSYISEKLSPCRPELRRELEQNLVGIHVRNECPFTVRSAPEELLNGFIDRLVVFERNGEPVAADVIDFKTDDVSTGEEALSERCESYYPQMTAYRTAVSHLLRIPEEQVSVRLAFLFAGVVVDVPQG